MNPRVSRSSALASKATGYPIARVAAQIAVGRRLAEIPNVVTGTTVAAFEPALDYVVVKLPRFPFDKFPTADRSLGSQMKATGEVMAIDRTFGAALNKALRGLEQAGVGPLAEDPAWTPTLTTSPAVRRRTTATRRRTSRSNGWTLAARPANRPATPSGRPRPIVLRRFLAPSDTRLWRVLGLLRRGVPEEVIGGATGIAPWFLAEMGRAVALEARGARRRAHASPTRPTPTRPSFWPRVKRAGFGDRELAGLAGMTADDDPGDPPRRSGSRPGYAMVDTCAAEFAAETPYFYSTYAAAGSPPEAPPVAGPAALVIGSGPVRIGQGIEFDYCAVQAADTLRAAGLAAVMINSNPETVSTDFDASTRLYFEPLDPESVRSVIDAETPDRGPRSSRPSSSSAARRRSTSPRRSPRAACRCSGATSRRSTRPRSGPGSRRCSTGSGSRSPRAGWRTRVEEALTLAERIGYPVIVRPSFVIGGLAIDFCYSPATSTASSRRRPSSTPTGRSGSTATSRASRSTSTRSRTAEASSSRGSSSTSSGRGSTRATRSGIFPPQTVSDGRPGAHRRDDGADRPGARAPAGWSTPSSSSARTAST